MISICFFKAGLLSVPLQTVLLQIISSCRAESGIIPGTAATGLIGNNQTDPRFCIFFLIEPVDNSRIINHH